MAIGQRFARSHQQHPGAVARLGRMQRDAGLVLWVAGNQFFAMDAVVRAFQTQNPAISVGLITLPPGLLLEAIEKGGWTYGGGS